MKRQKLKKYIIGYDPDSGTDADYSGCESLGEAQSTATLTRLKKKHTAWRLKSFDTLEEKNAYIKGLRDGLGYLGDPVIFENNPE